MKKMFLLFSHNLSEIQLNDAKSNLEVSEVVSLPNKLQDIWSNIPADIENLREYLLSIRNFLAENSQYGDVVLIQGDFGAVYQMVNFSKDLGLIPVYATTSREIEEFEENGKTIKKSIFEHIRFRGYL
ncbi:CRISPR-associated protein Csx20 [Arcobacter cloacae]|uniref:Uncharacterized protein n=1 Tax=Arcobacter cloacae TaxID=1054034 RepID=A0A6M8NRC6_9BACT|nr:CRISPR-associated protein Csx20 [Arcobacter cloacae]QKF91147.1 hypothetical protein ACLO_a0056 [Arcobacter cloacae]RXI40480.1 hypothetical protein CP963_08805 [Arcobacter cloacae]